MDPKAQIQPNTESRVQIQTQNPIPCIRPHPASRIRTRTLLRALAQAEWLGVDSAPRLSGAESLASSPPFAWLDVAHIGSGDTRR